MAQAAPLIDAREQRHEFFNVFDDMRICPGDQCLCRSAHGLIVYLKRPYARGVDRLTGIGLRNLLGTLRILR